MEIVRIPIDQINPAPYNPRRDLKPGDADYDGIKKVITEFSLVEPLVMNTNGNVLIGGHQRLKVLKELGYTEVEVSLVDLPVNKEKALNLALNKISGDWDNARLKDILQELDVGDLDMSLTGFNLEEIENLMTQEHQTEPDKKQQSGEVTCPDCGCVFVPKKVIDG
jgi:ParB-like chromosome segregation protein Spo0J